MKLLRFLPKPKKPSGTGLPGFLLRRVAGGSMRPGFPPGRIIVAWQPAGHMQPGDVALVRRGRNELIKRISQLEADRAFVEGDDAANSTDSRDFGWLPRHAIIAKVVWPRAAPPDSSLRNVAN